MAKGLQAKGQHEGLKNYASPPEDSKNYDYPEEYTTCKQERCDTTFSGHYDWYIESASGGATYFRTKEDDTTNRELRFGDKVYRSPGTM